ncbi:MAG TPA: thioredoxin domain-containing protein [Actinocrinis sp.]|nr:thioredoxin domain-containing protein [Actinocrinis sp.]
MNRLGSATSPYLLQHANNPVDWWPWGEEAISEAKRRDVPILISVGYAACHWCHVMAHESFEDPSIAALMNDRYVCIKVDREERPDVDAVYMAATQAMTGHGGWPMTVFATHDGRPFYCGTYFPKVQRPGMISFPELLARVDETWRNQREEIERVGAQVAGELARTGAAQPFGGGEALGDETLAAAVAVLAGEFDPVHAGFGGAPKFPPSMTLVHLLRHHQRTGDTPALDLVARTCEAMARGGIYDQLGGGFARYAVDATWTIPHFEKMLYDNALLLRAYVLWWKASDSPLARRVAQETAQFLLRDLRTTENGFASALDADTDGVEGLTYVWSPASLTEVLGETDGPWAATLFGVTARGNFEHGESVLELPADPDGPENAARYERARELLFAARALRPQPHRDDKVVAAWNGLAITALVEASLAFEDKELLAAATAAAELLVSVHITDGRLVRTSRDGRASVNQGVLEDYGCVAEAFAVLYSANGERRWLELAEDLLTTVRTQFRSVVERAEDRADQADQADRRDDQIAWHDTAADSAALYYRPSDPTDNATPSGLSAAAAAFAAYGLAAGSLDHLDDAYLALGATARLADRAPRFAGYGLAVAEALAAEIPKAFVCPGPFC